MAEARFTDEQLMAALDEGLSLRECARRFGVGHPAVMERYAKLKAKGYARPATDIPEAVVKPMLHRPRLSQVIDLPPAPFAVPIAKAPAPKPGKSVVAVVVGDMQVPFEDPKALDVAEGIIKQTSPDILLHMGDLVDCYSISDHDKDPARLDNLQDDIDASRRYLHRWAQLAPKARRVLLEGNHEDRLRRVIWNLPDTARQLAKLRAFQQAMAWPNLLQLDDIGWEWIPGDRQSRTEVLPQLITIHGHQLKGSSVVEGANARKAMQKYGRSVVVGHHHRACTIMRRDHNGQAFGIETGALCLLEQPYGSDFNWQQAVTVIEWSGDRKVMHVEQVVIRDGRARWRGADYRAAA